MRKIKATVYRPKHDLPIWADAVVEAFKGKHHVRVYDEHKPLADQFKGSEMIVDIGGWGTDEMIDAAVDAKLWQILGTGLDHTNIARIKSKGIMIANCPGSLCSTGLAECAMMFILMLSRNFYEAQADFRVGNFFQPFGLTLNNLTLGIIGLGASGQKLAQCARPFGLRIEAIDVCLIEPQILQEIQPDFMGSIDDLDDVIARADFLSLHLPLNDKTYHIIDAHRLAMMKKTSCIINVARGALVDEPAMYEALLQGRLGGAGLDVFSKEPPDMTTEAFKLPNVILMPHVAGSTDDAFRKRVDTALENANRLAQNKEPIYLIDESM